MLLITQIKDVLPKLEDAKAILIRIFRKKAAKKWIPY